MATIIPLRRAPSAPGANHTIAQARVFGFPHHADILPEPPRSIHDAPYQPEPPRSTLRDWLRDLPRRVRLWRHRRYLAFAQGQFKDARIVASQAMADQRFWSDEIRGAAARIEALDPALSRLGTDLDETETA